MACFKSHITIRDDFCVESKAQPCGIVIFGASGDLTARKLIPALFHLFHRKLLPHNFFIVGCGRSSISSEDFRDKIAAALVDENNKLVANDTPYFKEVFYDEILHFVNRCTYVIGEYQENELYLHLSKELKVLNKKFGTGGNHIFYLATPPQLYNVIPRFLSENGLITESGETSPWSRVVVEKPFGHDLASAVRLDTELHEFLSEKQIYRIDHYLGKETVQNILIFRFANAIFEPVWNRHYIDHVQITVSESLGVGHRYGYYEQAGLMRDMFQNHMLQMMALVAMEPPVSFEPDEVRDEKVKLLQSVRKLQEDWIIRGQYIDGVCNGEAVCSYRKEKGVNPHSNRETFVAARLFVDNWRWKDVPFYLRSGKRLPQKVSEIAVFFKKVPHSIFTPISSDDLAPNVLVFHVQPEQGVSLTIHAKRPGPKLCMSSLTMDFNYEEIFGADPPDAYQRLLLDCMLGDQTLFIRHDDMQVAWTLISPILEKWEIDQTAETLYPYPAGTWGPEQSELLLKKDKRKWYSCEQE